MEKANPAIIAAIIGAIATVIAAIMLAAPILGPFPPSPIPAQEEYNYVRLAQEKFANGHIVYTNITQMVKNHTYEFEARIATNESVENMTKEFAPGPTVIRDLKVHNAMEAILTSDDEKIETQPRSEQIQEIPELDPGHNYGVWLWNVKPNGVGHHNLTLAAYAIIDTPSMPSLPQKKMHLETIRVPINVTVEQAPTGPTGIAKLAEDGKSILLNGENLKWIIATLLIPAIGWLYRQRGKKRKNKKKS